MVLSYVSGHLSNFTQIYSYFHGLFYFYQLKEQMKNNRVCLFYLGLFQVPRHMDALHGLIEFLFLFDLMCLQIFPFLMEHVQYTQEGILFYRVIKLLFETFYLYFNKWNKLNYGEIN